MDSSLFEKAKSIKRQLIGLGIYRCLLDLVFLVTIFRTTTDPWTANIVIGYLVFSASMQALVILQLLHFQLSCALADAEARKTQWTIFESRYGGYDPADLPQDFWDRVNREVEREQIVAFPPASAGWWARAGLVVAHTVGNLVAGLIIVLLASFLSGAI